MQYYSSKTQKSLDKKIMRIAERSDILRFLDPKNKKQELQKFLSAHGKYNPQFQYEDMHIPQLPELLEYIAQLKNKCTKMRTTDNPWSILKSLMIEKCDELESKFKLIQAYHEQNLSMILTYNEQLFGPLQDFGDIKPKQYNLLDHAYKVHIETVLEPLALQNHQKLNHTQTVALVQHHLHNIGLSNYQIIFWHYGMTNMQISIGPKPVIYIHKKTEYKSSDMCISIYHEIYGHLLRYIQGAKSWIHLLQWGTSWYLTTEEGIAVFQAARLEWFDIVWNRLLESYQHLHKARELNWMQMTEYYLDLGWKSLESIFWSILRLKRGAVNTEIIHPGTLFLKDKVYADGYFHILHHLISQKQKNKKVNNTLWVIFDTGLFYWRIKSEDIAKITCILDS